MGTAGSVSVEGVVKFYNDANGYGYAVIKVIKKGVESLIDVYINHQSICKKTPKVDRRLRKGQSVRMMVKYDFIKDQLFAVKTFPEPLLKRDFEHLFGILKESVV